MKKIIALLSTVVLLFTIQSATIMHETSQYLDINSSYFASSDIKIDTAIPVSSSGNQPGRKS